MAHVRVIAKLVRLPQREIIAAESFDAEIASTGTSINEIVVAFDEALGKVLKRIVHWAMPVIAR
jgi:cholesterol transport system auxiliary component